MKIKGVFLAAILAAVLCFSGNLSAATYGGGSGSSGDPFLILTPAQLNLIGATPADWGSYFKLMANIDMSGYTGTAYHIIGNSLTHFTGGFDGNGYVISNLTYSTTSTIDYVGLFGYTDNAAIKNLGLENINFPWMGGAFYVGGLVGQQYNGTITNCYSTGIITSEEIGMGRSACAGGLVGWQYSGTITNCYSTCTVTASSNDAYFVPAFSCAGGLVGSQYYGTVTNCYSTGAVHSSASTDGSASSDAGGLVGEQNYGITTNCYSTGTVTASSSQTSNAGGLVGGLYGGSSTTIEKCYSTGGVSATGSTAHKGGLLGYNGSSGTIAACFWDTQTSGLTISAGGTGKTTVQMKTESTFTSAGWDFAWTDGDSADWVLWIEGQSYPTLTWQPATFGGGGGTLGDPWKIATVGHLLYLAYNSAYYSGSYIMTADIDLSAYTGIMYQPIGNAATKFTGTFNGSGHIIRNLSYSTTSVISNVGLFGYTSGATIQNLGVENADILSHGDAVGGLIGYQYRGHIYNCYTTGSVEGRDGVGGMVGAELGSIDNSYSTASVTGTGSLGGTGGLVGAISGNEQFGVRRCYSAGAVDGGLHVGGLIGYSNNGIVLYSFWDTMTSGRATSAGGAGKNTTQMKTKSTFTTAPASWDFLDETTNGTNDYWRMCSDGVGYPRLTWSFVKSGDFRCSDGVDIEDFRYFVQRWLRTDCAATGNCEGADMNVSGTVNAVDFAIFARHWLEGI